MTEATCARCEAQGRVITRLARELAEARIALATIRDATAGLTAGDYREIRAIAVAALPSLGDGGRTT